MSRLDDAGFRALFAKSAVKRIGRARFLRNVLIAIGNSGRPELLAVAAARLDDEDELVRGAAVWAVARLAQPHQLRELAAARLVQERSLAVVEEWGFVLADEKMRA